MGASGAFDPARQAWRTQAFSERAQSAERDFGARKVWRQLRREGFTIARCTVERLKPLSREDVPARQHFELAYVRNGNCKLQRRPQRQAARSGVRGLGAIRPTGFMRATSVRGRCTRLVACMTMTTGGTRPSC